MVWNCFVFLIVPPSLLVYCCPLSPNRSASLAPTSLPHKVLITRRASRLELPRSSISCSDWRSTFEYWRLRRSTSCSTAQRLSASLKLMNLFVHPASIHPSVHLSSIIHSSINTSILLFIHPSLKSVIIHHPTIHPSDRVVTAAEVFNYSKVWGRLPTICSSLSLLTFTIVCSSPWQCCFLIAEHVERRSKSAKL